MFYYKAIHKYQLDKNFEIKEIGVFDSQKKAAESIENVKNKPGFAEYRGYVLIRIILIESQTKYVVIKNKKL